MQTGELLQAEVAGLMIYDVKALGGRAVERANITERGLMDQSGRRDHQFLVVEAVPIDANGVHKFLRQNDHITRDTPEGMAAMARVIPQLDGQQMLLTWDGNKKDAIEIDNPRQQGGRMKVNIWKHDVNAINQGDGANKWLSDHLGHEVVVVKMDSADARPVSEKYTPNDSRVLAQDAYPINTALIESAKRVSELAGMDIPWTHYRPQIAIKDIPDKSEHKISTVDIRNRASDELIATAIHGKPGVRCRVTGVIPNLGTRLPGNQPLTALGKERAWIDGDGDLQLIFAENLIVKGQGEIVVGDKYIGTSSRYPRLVYGPIEKMKAVQKEVKKEMAKRGGSISAREMAFIVQSLAA